MRNSLLTRLAMTLIAVQLLLVIISWLLSAMMTDGVRSLLSSEGIRWFFGSFTTIVGSPLLANLLLILSATGCLLSMRQAEETVVYRKRVARQTALTFLIIYVVIIVLLTLPSQAILRSATGHLFPSAFSRSLVALVAFAVILPSVVYGLMIGRMRSLDDILCSLSTGIAKGAPIIIIYILLIQLLGCFKFVFGGYFASF